MTQALRAWLRRHPRLKAAVAMLLRGRSGVSSNYVAVDANLVPEVTRELEGAWRDDSLPERQRKLVDAQLRDYRAGTPVAVFEALVGPLRRLAPARGATLLEVGCSSGYYSEVLAAAGMDVRYSGCDYSPAFVELARRCYPQLQFDVMDATRLAYGESAFEIVVSGCCLLHIPDYQRAIAETARVAARHAIFHRTPVRPSGRTRHFTKLAYGVKTLEIHFGEEELLGLFRQHGLHVVETMGIDEYAAEGDMPAVKTYVCSKDPG